MHLMAIPALQDNYVWYLSAGAGSTVLVDPGQAAPVLEALVGQPAPDAILLTHHHPDHCAGVPELLERWPGLPVYAPADDRIVLATRPVAGGDMVKAGGLSFEVIEVPGHTRSHVAFVASTGQLFCGDTLFSLGCGRMFEGTPLQMLASLDRMARLLPATAVCPGHEYTLANAAFARVVDPDNDALRRRTEEAKAMRADGRPTLPSSLASELAANPFLRVDAAAVRSAVEGRLGRPARDRVEVFAELRHWKDGFRA